jgi:hypothetical protein
VAVAVEQVDIDGLLTDIDKLQYTFEEYKVEIGSEKDPRVLLLGLKVRESCTQYPNIGRMPGGLFILSTHLGS